ncbi:MAG TPA: hypothetical protein VGN86_08205, partial [Pyrinomonadaceae bacterium]|nr:hypothetical protein [Pyrinomonadaceae bacterium]
GCPLMEACLLSSAPVTGTAALVSNGQDADFFAGYRVDQRIWKTLHEVTTPTTAAPRRTQSWVLQENIDRLFEFGQEGLRQTIASAIAIELGSVPEVCLRLRVQRIIH